MALNTAKQYDFVKYVCMYMKGANNELTDDRDKCKDTTDYTYSDEWENNERMIIRIYI